MYVDLAGRWAYSQIADILLTYGSLAYSWVIYTCITIGARL